jgi:hypothetical protein
MRTELVENATAAESETVLSTAAARIATTTAAMQAVKKARMLDSPIQTSMTFDCIPPEDAKITGRQRRT